MTNMDVAVKALRATRREVVRQYESDVKRIDAAISALTEEPLFETPARLKLMSPEKIEQGRVVAKTIIASLTMKEQVLRVLDEAVIPLTNDDIARQLRTVQGDRDEKAFKSGIRTALWSLRKEGLATQDDAGRNMVADGHTETSPAGSDSQPEADG